MSGGGLIIEACGNADQLLDREEETVRGKVSSVLTLPLEVNCWALSDTAAGVTG